ncbi:MAG: Mov34/MPN/PAD-1 family protein [Syntrophales bacterium]
MSNPKSWDEYEIKARYIPCFIAAIPPVHFLIQLLGPSFWETIIRNVGWMLVANISLSLVSSADFFNSRLLIDTTASLSVRSYLMSQTSLSPIISCMLFGSWALGVSLIEGKGRQTRLDDLWANLYLYSLDDSWLRDILFSDQKNSVLIGQSCSSHTVVMSDANLSLLAASMGLRIQRILEDGFPAVGEIMLSRITDQYGLSSSRYDVAKSIEVPSITKKDWNVRISDSVVEKMKDQSIQAGENETGGCIMGSVFLAARSIVITDILPPPPDSISKPSLFVLGTDGLEARIKTIERKTHAKVTYLGTWHSHPRGGTASGTDKDTAVRLLFVRHYEPTVCLIWTPEGLIQV